MKVTEAPLGIPDALRLTALLKLPPIVVVIVEPAALPCATVKEDGAAETARVGCPLEVTVTETAAVCVSPPPKPLTTIGYVPVGVPDEAETVIVEVPAPGAAIEVGEKLTLMPVGMPTAAGAIELLNPPETVVLIVAVAADPPATTVREFADVDKV